MNRRSLLTAALSAPAVALAGSLPVVAAAETPVMALYRKWRACNEWINGLETRGLPSEVIDALCDDERGIIQQMILTPAQNTQDLCAKLLAVTEMGTIISYVDLEGAECLSDEARALIA